MEERKDEGKDEGKDEDKNYFTTLERKTRGKKKISHATTESGRGGGEEKNLTRGDLIFPSKGLIQG